MGARCVGGALASAVRKPCELATRDDSIRCGNPIRARTHFALSARTRRRVIHERRVRTEAQIIKESIA